MFSVIFFEYGILTIPLREEGREMDQFNIFLFLLHLTKFMSDSFYNRNLKDFAIKLRNDSTLTEVIIWSNILKDSKTGYPFLRQRPIGKYIADFMCRRLKLIIELDGYSHENRFDADIQRDLDLEKIGYKTLRIQDEDIFTNLDNVERTIIYEMKERERLFNLESKVISNFDF